MWYDGVCTVCCSSRHSPPLQNLYIRSAWAFDIKHIQGWKFALSLFRSKLLILKSDRDAIRLRSSLQKSNREQFVLIALYKRARWANRSCCSLKKKLWGICSCPSWQKSDGSELLSLLLKKSDRSDSLVIPVNCSPKREICSTKLIFFLCFWQFFTAFPLFMPRRELLFTKEPGERIALVALKKKTMWVLCSSLDRITCKKRAIPLKNSYVFDSFSPFYAQERIAPFALLSFSLF